MKTNSNRASSRISFTGIMMIVLMLMLMVRLFHIQVVLCRNYSQRAAKQRMLKLPLNLFRGQFYDINMIPLTGRQPAKGVIVSPELVKDSSMAAEVTTKAATANGGDSLQGLKETTIPCELSLLKDDEQLGECNKNEVTIAKGVERYDEKSLARHLIGYTDKSDNVGRAGLERLYDGYLSGGGQSIIAAVVDNSKRLIPGLGYKLIGNEYQNEYCHVRLTINYHIQRVVEEIMDESNMEGTVVVLDAQSGKIAAMASRPNYGQYNVEEYLGGRRGELLNKAFQQYNIGSIFKTVVAAAALENNLIDPRETVNCPGYINVGSLQIKCSSYDTGGHGKVDMFNAYAKSCNTFFIETGQRLGAKRIIEMAGRFGFGDLVGINPSEEQPGLIPPISELYNADVCNISIGQGDIMVTPLQVAVMTGIIANNGTRKQVGVVECIMDGSGQNSAVSFPENAEQVISPDVALKLRKMMELAVDQGTATSAALPEHGGTAGKTSSAQTGQRNEGREVLHAWFTGYVPRHNPKYVITVLVEDGRSGGSVAAPVFRNIALGIVELGIK